MGPAVVGVDLGGTNLRAGLLNRDGEFLERHKEATHASEGWQQVVGRVTAAVRKQIEAAEKGRLTVGAIGVGAPGVIQVEQGIVVKSPNFPDWNRVPLKALLQKELGLPVFIENDANAAALGEQWLGAGKSIRSMILITLGTGVGGGIILNNNIWHGADGMAGEIGHMTIIPNGRSCSCGNTGCLEMYASARGIVQSYREALEPAVRKASVTVKPVTSEDVYEAARKGSQTALCVMKNMGTMLGIGIANLINIFNPERVVIGGGVKEAWDLFMDAARNEITRRAFEAPAQRTEIVPAVLGDDAGMAGAAAVALGSVCGK